MKNELQEEIAKQHPIGKASGGALVDLPYRGRITPGLIELICQDIVNLVDPERIILFGSRARGEIREGSDLDLFVIVDHAESNRDTARRIRRALYEYGVPIDLIVRHPEEVERNIVDGNPFYLYHVFGDGVTLYERSAAEEIHVPEEAAG